MFLSMKQPMSLGNVSMILEFADAIGRFTTKLSVRPKRERGMSGW